MNLNPQMYLMQSKIIKCQGNNSPDRMKVIPFQQTLPSLNFTTGPIIPTYSLAI